MVEKKYTLITGASSGIGRSLALVFAQNHHHLVIVARRKTQLEELKQTIENINPGLDVVVEVADLRLSSERNALYQRLNGKSIEILINNAGLGHCNPFVHGAMPLHDAVIQVNITALVELTHLFSSQLIKNKGRIVNIASLAAYTPGPNMAVYYASKAFVHSFSSAISAELKSHGVSVTTIYPGPVTTEFASVSGMALPKWIKHSKINPSAAEVAEISHQAIMARVKRLVPGWGHKMMRGLITVIPESIHLWFLARIQQRK